MKIVSVQDTKAERYGKPFVVTNLAVAERDFAAATKDEKSPMAMFPEDIQLVYLGEFDECTGKITGLEKPVLVAQAKDYIAKGDQKNG